ncbi:MAG: hypothetical protein C4308_03305 [Chitinophagaceae bacterium]
MNIKDYYKILEVPPYASFDEIKQAYRRLAMIHHPDKNNNDPYAIAQFNEMKEAYEILTNPAKKNNWLQQRWFNQAMGRKKTATLITPVNILKRLIELEKYVAALDVHRMDKESIKEYLLDLLSNDAIEQLNNFHEPAIKKQICSESLKIIRSFKTENYEQVCLQLQKLVVNDAVAVKLIEISKANHSLELFWEKARIYWVIGLTIVICLLIFFMSR